MPRITILVNQQPFHVESSTLGPQDFRNLVGAPADYEVWRIVRDPDPEGQLPVDDVQITGATEVANGNRFRVVPPGTFGVRIPSSLELHVSELAQQGYKIQTIQEDGLVYLIFSNYQLPPGYSKPRTNLLLKVPLSYPNGKLDMFWTDPDLRLANNGMPRQTTSEQILGASWLRFSWHPSNWNPSTDNLKTFLEFVNQGLLKARQ